MSAVLADGQLPSTIGTIYTSTGNRAVAVTCQNTSGSSTETVTLSVIRSGGTVRRLCRAVLGPNEQLVVNGLQLGPSDVVQGVATDATTVDYLVAGSSGPLTVLSLDANGAPKSNNGGQETGAVGASTAAAGTTTADAGVLPAATALIYPTTAADGTAGVRVNAADKVTGRKLFIGNGVSNAILKVYAPSGGKINGASADAAFSSVSGKGVIIVCLSAASNTWLAW